MSRYIDADALLEFCNNAKSKTIDCNDIARFPSIDIKTGKWQITSAYPHIVYCSECHRRYAEANWAVWNDPDYPLPRNYCPNCGAKMEGIDE